MASHNILCKNLDIHASLSDLAIVSMLSAQLFWVCKHQQKLEFSYHPEKADTRKEETIYYVAFFIFL